MSCRFKEECPSYSGWCEGPKQDFSRCVEFLITAYENEKDKNSSVGRACKVKDRTGYFHMWEQHSKPLAASPLRGGAPAGVFSKVYGIVEFEDGTVGRVDPTEIQFCDEVNVMLRDFD